MCNYLIRAVLVDNVIDGVDQKVKKYKKRKTSGDRRSDWLYELWKKRTGHKER